MKFIIFFTVVFFCGCQATTLKVEDISAKQIANNSISQKSKTEISSIRDIDFQNFTFPWTKTFGYEEKSFSLKKGIANLPDERKLSLRSVSYIDVADNYEEQALIIVDMDDGNGSYEMLYIFAVKNNQPIVLESFEFGEDSSFLVTAFASYGELIIETNSPGLGDAQCCPSINEIYYYQWHRDKFVLQGEPQKILNGYVERQKKKRTNSRR